MYRFNFIFLMFWLVNFCFSAEFNKNDVYTMDFSLVANEKLENRLFIDIKFEPVGDDFVFEFTRAKLPYKISQKESGLFAIELLNSEKFPAYIVAAMPFGKAAILRKNNGVYECDDYSYSRFKNCKIRLAKKSVLNNDMQRLREIVELKFNKKEDISNFDMQYGFMNISGEKMYENFGVNLSTILRDEQCLRKLKISPNLINAVFSSRIMFECSPIRLEDLSEVVIKENSAEQFQGSFCYNILDQKVKIKFSLSKKAEGSLLSFWVVDGGKSELILKKLFQ